MRRKILQNSTSYPSPALHEFWPSSHGAVCVRGEGEGEEGSESEQSISYVSFGK